MIFPIFNFLSINSFRVGQGKDIRVDVHKNRRNPLDPVVVSFKVKGVPKYDIPKPVMLRKKAPEIEKDKVKNIPCPYDNCEELLSREEFRGHLNQHRWQNKSSENVENVEEKSPVVVTNNENIVPLKMEMKQNTDVMDGAWSKVECDEEKDQSDVTLDKMDVTEDSVEIVEIKSADNSLNKSKQSEKQSSILNFFKRFDPRPKDEVEEIYAKKAKSDLLSPTFKSTPKSIKPGKNKSGVALEKKVPNIIEHFANISTPVEKEGSPERNDENVNTANKVISSPLGFFKIDQSSSLNQPKKLPTFDSEVKGDATEEQRQDKHFKHYRRFNYNGVE